jgi:muconolactone delta-isomerase
MEFLVMATMKESIVTLPPSVVRKLCEAATPGLEQAKKEGKIKEFYYIPGWRFMLITEESSAEEMMKNMNQNPAIGLMNFEVHPLADGIEAWKDGIENLKLAEKTAA